ncbi:amidase [Truncatella angustata]|uniref:amidase n=1 Tax=Truncatella angustata TaxID=152316 RepID=A0A9P8ZUR0_9PEZI|nr:amidase [Truncatella angustata]KAH6649192.1 amidase [Truncatella angustata]
MTPWEEIAKNKRADVLSKIPAQWRLPASFCSMPTSTDSPDLDVTTDEFLSTLPLGARLSTEELAATAETSITAILNKYRSQQLTAEELVTAFCHRAAINHQMTDSIAEIRFEEAIKEAKSQDAYFRANNKLVGPLHGIPVSLKDQLRVEGLETAMGYVGWLGRKETTETESLLVKQIKALGGIIIAKTHVPQTLMLGEELSNLHGPGLNPYNRLLSPGGSSGGEGSLLASRGSVIGVGADQGGSLRVPAAFNNLFGLKPSHGRVSSKRVAASLAGKPVIPAVVGPMSTKIENLIHFTRAIIETEAWQLDPTVINLPWRPSVIEQVRAQASAGGLCFAVLSNDGLVRPHPPVARGVQLTVDAARRAGHKVIEWKPPSHLLGGWIGGDILYAATYDVHDALKLSGEPLLQSLEPLFGKKKPNPTMSLQEYYELMTRFREYQDQYAEYWESTKSLSGTGRPVDGIIAPVAPHAAVRHNCFFSSSYTLIHNLLDHAAVTVPVTFADKSMDIAPSSVSRMNDIDGKNWNSYDAEIYHGAPVGIQVVGRRLEEEKVLALGEVLSEALKTAATDSEQ